MLLSNKLLWALRDHAAMRDPKLADLCLEADLKVLEDVQNAPDKFDRPVPVRVRINKETGAILPFWA